MASLCEDRGRPDKRGRRPKLYRIMFKSADGGRKALRLGKIPERKAQTILSHVAHLEGCLLDGSAPPPETSAWVAGRCGDTLRKRLARAGLAAPKVETIGHTLGAVVAAYKDRPRWRDLAERTRDNYEYGFAYLLARFGEKTPVSAITETAAEDFRGYLSEAKPTGAGLSRATSNTTCRTASMLFRFAVRSRLIGANPFEGVERGSVVTTHRAFVDAGLVYRLIDAMKDSEWRLLVALARWGGVRVPSEPRLLRWGDIDRDRNRIVITSPKTGRHAGHERRVIPLFPELEPFIQERFDDAEPGEFVLPMMQRIGRGAFNSHIRYTLERIGIEKWPRAFHNLRSTRQTELEEVFPSHVVCAWMGNSEAIARRHYLQVTEDHFAKAAHNAAQPAHARERTAPPKRWARRENRLDCPAVAEAGEAVRDG